MRRTQWVRRKDAATQVRDVVGDMLSRPSHRHCRHRCERPLRMDAPSTGWVTALAGLLARGSTPSCVKPSRFPSGFRRGLSAHSCGGSHGLLQIRIDEFVVSVFPLSSPESPREPAPLKCSLEVPAKSRHRRPGRFFLPRSRTKSASRIVLFRTGGFVVSSSSLTGEIPP